MIDLLQGLIGGENKLRAVHINRGWFEIDDCDGLKVVEGRAVSMAFSFCTFNMA